MCSVQRCTTTRCLQLTAFYELSGNENEEKWLLQMSCFVLNPKILSLQYRRSLDPLFLTYNLIDYHNIWMLTSKKKIKLDDPENSFKQQRHIQVSPDQDRTPQQNVTGNQNQ